MSRMLFVNLAVKDLDATVEFFTKLGFEFDPQFTDATATCMIVNDQTSVMLLVESRFKDFVKKEIVDTSTHIEAILALSAESRDEVDQLVTKALDAGGQPANDKMDMGFMYGWSFYDLDGHLWEVMWMDAAAPQADQPEARATDEAVPSPDDPAVGVRGRRPQTGELAARGNRRTTRSGPGSAKRRARRTAPPWAGSPQEGSTSSSVSQTYRTTRRKRGT